MDIGVSITIVGTAFAVMGAIIGVVKTVYTPDRTWQEPIDRIDSKYAREIDAIKERIHSVETAYEAIKHLTGALQEIKDMIRKLEQEEREDILKLESKIEKLGDLILKSLQQE